MLPDDSPQYQGAVEITQADVTSRCGQSEKTLFLNYGGTFGASFSAVVNATPGRYNLDIRFHYKAPGAAGGVDVNCSDPTDPNGPSRCKGGFSRVADLLPL